MPKPMVPRLVEALLDPRAVDREVGAEQVGAGGGGVAVRGTDGADPELGAEAGGGLKPTWIGCTIDRYGSHGHQRRARCIVHGARCVLRVAQGLDPGLGAEAGGGAIDDVDWLHHRIASPRFSDPETTRTGITESTESRVQGARMRVEGGVDAREIGMWPVPPKGRLVSSLSPKKGDWCQLVPPRK